MRLWLFKILILVSMFISGCATQTLPENVDLKKVSELNAQLGVEYMSKGKNDIALKKLEKAIEFDPYNGNAHHYLAELHRRLDEHEKADKHYRKALKLLPEDSSLKNNYAIYLCDTKQYQEAQEYFEKVLADPLYSKKYQTYENMGVCAKTSGNLLKAETAFRNALKLNQYMPRSLLGMSGIEFDKKKISSAYEYFKKYEKLTKHNSESLWMGVLLEKHRGNKSKAASYGLLLKGMFPDSKEAEYYRKLEASASR